jgi:hypothetical protein
MGDASPWRAFWQEAARLRRLAAQRRAVRVAAEESSKSETPDS